MTQAGENVRRDLREHSWLRYTDKPFGGAVHNFSRPMRERLKSREHCGPYYYQPTAPGGGRSFYQSSKRLACGDSTFDMRLELANDHLDGWQTRTTAYWCDSDGFSALTPIVARLPHGRGFLAGWTMGEGMCGAIDLDIYGEIGDAARAAHSMAENDAEKERDYQEQQDAESVDSDDC